MSPLSDALTAAHLREATLSGPHCSACSAYTVTTKAGEGRCAENEGAAVRWTQVCDKWKARC